MNTVFHITRAFIFLILASFASTAWSITVSSELGGTSLDGAWDHGGCTLDNEDEYDGDYFREYLIFEGTNVEARIAQFGTDSNCIGIGTIAESETFTFTDEGNTQSLGWEDTSPACQDPSATECQDNDTPGHLDPDPLITEIEIFIPGEGGEEDELETIYWYIDDTDQTDLIWYLYRTAEDENEEPTLILSSEEPFFKTDLAVGVIPVPAGIWLFGTALIGFVGYGRRRKIG
jgi:hypothetical protein